MIIHHNVALSCFKSYLKLFYSITFQPARSSVFPQQGLSPHMIQTRISQHSEQTTQLAFLRKHKRIQYNDTDMNEQEDFSTKAKTYLQII